MSRCEKKVASDGVFMCLNVKKVVNAGVFMCLNVKKVVSDGVFRSGCGKSGE